MAKLLPARQRKYPHTSGYLVNSAPPTISCKVSQAARQQDCVAQVHYVRRSKLGLRSSLRKAYPPNLDTSDLACCLSPAHLLACEFTRTSRRRGGGPFRARPAFLTALSLDIRRDNELAVRPLSKPAPVEA